MENNDKFLSQDLLESYAIRLLSGPLNGCEYEILNGRLLVIIGNDVSLGRSDAFSELPENTIVVPYGELTEVLGLKFAVKEKNEVWQYSLPGIIENNIISTKQHFFSSKLFNNDPQLRHIDKILVNKNRNYEILYGRDHVIYINTNILDEAVWVKQALEKINQESQYG
eukprot:gene16702-19857_t